MRVVKNIVYPYRLFNLICDPGIIPTNNCGDDKVLSEVFFFFCFWICALDERLNNIWWVSKINISRLFEKNIKHKCPLCFAREKKTVKMNEIFNFTQQN